MIRLSRTTWVAWGLSLMLGACLRPPPPPVAPRSEPDALQAAVVGAVPDACFSRAPFPDLHSTDDDGPPLTLPEGSDGGVPSVFGRDTARESGDAGVYAIVGRAVGREATDGGATKHAGSLDKEIVRRVIRHHIDEIRACYERTSPGRPLRAARILVKFAIGASGFVRHTRVVGSTMEDMTVDDCVARAMCGWQFPRPLGGGWVVVTYPYVLSPAGPP